MNHNHSPPAQTLRHGSNNPGTPTTKTTWVVKYARFFNFPSTSTSTTSTTLRPLFPKRKRLVKGTWVSSFSTNVSLHILFDRQEPTLVVSHLENVYEEHYVYNLHFTWPQVSCPSESAVEGSRVIFASFRDSMHQIQKFAVRFSSSAECQTFIESLKCLRDKWKVNCSRDTTSTSRHQRIDEESKSINRLVESTTTTLWQPTINQEHIPLSYPQHAMLRDGVESIDAGLPRSFTALINESCTETDPGVSGVPPQNQSLKGSVADYAFLDMLDKIEYVITALGGDLSFSGT